MPEPPATIAVLMPTTSPCMFTGGTRVAWIDGGVRLEKIVEGPLVELPSWR